MIQLQLKMWKQKKTQKKNNKISKVQKNMHILKSQA